ncbi:amidohydrolase family protein [Sphingobium algorifonticola]|nr:amidohydrolase family protein [Sphingobium algorifonticola]
MYPAIVDAHLHFLDPAHIDYPWLARFPVAIDMAEYARSARDLAIAGAIHVEGDAVAGQAVAEMEAVVSGARSHPSFPKLLGIIAGYRSSADEAVWDHPLIVGCRRVFVPLDDAAIVEMAGNPVMRGAFRAGGCFDLCIRHHQIGAAIQLVDSLPDTVRFVLDHCGNPDIAASVDASWRTGMTDLARRPNVAVKISGLTSIAGPDWTESGVAPFITTTIDIFGWDRVIWGSDWPVCNLHGSMKRWMSATRFAISGCSETEAARLFNGNARRWYELTAG